MKVDVFSSLKVDQWPELDRLLWREARAPGDLFDEAGLASHWRPATIVSVEYHYGTFLWWLEAMGRLDPQAKPADRASVVNIRAFTGAYSASHAQSSVGAVLRVIADFVRVTCPDADVFWIAGLARRVKRRAQPIKPPAHRRSPLLPLIQVAEALMERSELALIDDPGAGAVMFRDGLMIAMQVALPLRRKNMAALRIGASLIRDETVWRVEFPGKEMKNRQAFEGRYPASWSTRVDYYVQTIRPLLRARLKVQDDGVFWLGRWGEPMCAASISVRLRELTRKHLGVPLAAHSFRHSAATDIALLDPKHVGIIRSVLGHASELSATYYNLASTFEATQRYQKLLARLRDEGRGKG